MPDKTPEQIAAEQAAALAAQQQQEQQKPKTFTQEQVDDIVTKRLARDRAGLYKQFGIDDEAKIPDVIGKIKEYDKIKPEYETMKTSAAKAAKAAVLKTAGIDEAFIEFALTQVQGDTPEAYKENAGKYLAEHPKLRAENYQQINATLPINGGGAGLPDFAKMTTEQVLEWRRTHNWDGSAKK